MYLQQQESSTAYTACADVDTCKNSVSVWLLQLETAKNLLIFWNWSYQPSQPSPNADADTVPREMMLARAGCANSVCAHKLFGD